MLTSPEVDDDVDEEDGVGETVEGDPAGGEVVVEEGDCHGQDDEVRHQQQQHAQIPIKPEKKKTRKLQKLPFAFFKDSNGPIWTVIVSLIATL